MSSMDALLPAVPALRMALLVAGCIYLLALGIGLIVRPDVSNTPERSHRRLPEGFWGLFLFQFLNPKGWVLLVTAASAMSAPSGVAAYAQIAALFVVISLTCLSLWAALGRVFAVVQKGGVGAIWFERTMGCLLIGSAVLLLVER
jgi:threonine/homoserine/homoserine lactone efflux protein